MGDSPPRRAPGQRPRMLVCYLCSKEYGSKSLPIHVPKCQKRWLQEEEQKPKKERRPLPQPPAKELPIGTGGASPSSKEVDDFNDEARAAFEASLEQCAHCQRRFVPSALKHHSRACTAANPAKPAGTGLTALSLSNRLVPGAIAGSAHGNATEHPPPLFRMTGKQFKQLLKKQPGATGVRDRSQPARKDPGQSSKPAESKPWLGKNKEKLVDIPVEIRSK